MKAFAITLAVLMTTCTSMRPEEPLVFGPPTPPPPTQVLQAMTLLAHMEKTTPEKLMSSPEAVARVIQEQAEMNGQDPLLLVAIAWDESRFKADQKGDYLNGHPRSCGMTQVRTDFKGRPTCAQLLKPEFAIGWTAQHLNEIMDPVGRVRLNLYNGGGYEVKIWRLVDWLHRQTGRHASQDLAWSL